MFLDVALFEQDMREPAPRFRPRFLSPRSVEPCKHSTRNPQALLRKKNPATAARIHMHSKALPRGCSAVLRRAY